MRQPNISRQGVHKISKILIIAENPRLQTGQGRIGCNVANALHKAKHEILYLAWCPTEVNRDRQLPYQIIYARDYGEQLLDKLVIDNRPDVVLTIGDPWNFAYINKSTVRALFYHIAYTAVDGTGYSGGIPRHHTQYLHYADKIITYLDYGRRAILKTMPYFENKIDRIYHGIDTKKYYPFEKEKIVAIRKKYGLDGKNICLYVGRTQCRKNISYIFKAFKTMKDMNLIKNTFLWLHTNFSDQQNYNMDHMIEEFDLKEQVLCYQNIAYAESPLIGITEEELNVLYNVSDYLISPGGEGFGYCCHPDTNILIRNQVIKIKDVHTGLKVFTHRGRLKPITEVMRREIDENIICIKPEKFSQEIKITKEHPVLLQKTNGSTYFKEAGKLKIGDIAMYPVPSLKYYDKKYIYPADYIYELVSLSKRVHLYKENYNNETHRTTKHINHNTRGLPDKIHTDEFLELSAYWLSEGCNSNGEVIFGLNGKEDKDSTIKSFLKYISKKWKLDLRIVHDSRNRDRWIISSEILCEMLSNIYGDGAHNKTIPYWFLHLNIKRLKKFVVAIWRGDGCTYKRKGRIKNYEHSYITVSPHLANFLKLILLKIGMVPNFYYFSKRKSYVLKIHNQYKSIEQTIINTNEFEKLATGRFYIPLKITELRKERYKGFVYNLEVKDDESYLTESFAIHNCIAEAMCTKTPVITVNDSGGGELCADGRGYLVEPTGYMTFMELTERPLLNPKEVVAKIIECRDSDNTEVVEKAYDWAVANLSISKIDREWQDYFKRFEHPLDHKLILEAV